jgi:hypothetical protein
MLITINDVEWVSPLDSTTAHYVSGSKTVLGNDCLDPPHLVRIPNVVNRPCGTVLNPTALLDYAARYCWTAARRGTATRAARCGLAARTLSAGRRRAATGRS